MNFVVNNLVIGGYESSNDLLIFVGEAYRRCFNVGEPVDFFELDDNLDDIINDSGINMFNLKGVPISRYEVSNMLDYVLNEFLIEYIDSCGRHLNDSQNTMFEEMLE